MLFRVTLTAKLFKKLSVSQKSLRDLEDSIQDFPINLKAEGLTRFLPRNECTWLSGRWLICVNDL